MAPQSDVICPSEKRIKSDVEHLKEWMAKEAHLPKIQDEEWLATFLYNSKFSLEKTKSKLDGYYSMRTKYPQVFKNRDPLGEEMLQARNYIKIAFCPKPMRDGSILFYTKFGDPSSFDAVSYNKRQFMFCDYTLNDKKFRLDNIVSIVDFQDFSYVHILKLMQTIAMTAEILNVAQAGRSKCVHFINFPSFGQKFLEALMRYFPSKLVGRVHVYSKGDDSLIDAIDEDLLCSDYGGKGPSLDELEAHLQEELEKLRGWFAKQDSIYSNEDLRKKGFHQVEVMRGSFRKLEVD